MYHAMKMYGGVKIQLHTFLIMVLDGGEWSASHPSCFTSEERDPYAHLIGWASPRASLDTVIRGENPFTAPARNRTLVIWPIAQSLY
jgi:hypothetical protein